MEHDLVCHWHILYPQGMTHRLRQRLISLTITFAHFPGGTPLTFPGSNPSPREGMERYKKASTPAALPSPLTSFPL